MLVSPGDRFVADVTRVRSLTSGPQFLKAKVKIVHADVHIPGRVQPKRIQASWNIEKFGYEPVVGTCVMVEYHRTVAWVAGYRPARAKGFRFVIEKSEENAMKKRLIGRVNRDFHPCAVYVRISVMRHDGVPLAIKATRDGFDRKLFKRDRVVEVEQCGSASFRVTAVFMDSNEDETLDERCECYDTDSDDGTVRFFLGKRYFHGDTRDRMARVLRLALGVTPHEAAYITKGDGTWITCRESQFARFMIHRDEEGIPNMFQDLRVERILKKTKPKNEIDVTGR